MEELAAKRRKRYATKGLYEISGLDICNQLVACLCEKISCAGPDDNGRMEFSGGREKWRIF